MEQENRIVTKAAWTTQMKSTPPLTEEYKRYIYTLYEVLIKFLQDKGFLTRTVLKDGEKANDDTELIESDFTEQGGKFYSYGVNAWLGKLDRSKRRYIIVHDTSFLEKKYKEFMEKSAT